MGHVRVAALALAQIIGRVAGELARELVGELRIVLLQRTRGVRVGVGHGDHRVALCAWTGAT